MTPFREKWLRWVGWKRRLKWGAAMFVKYLLLPALAGGMGGLLTLLAWSAISK